MGQEGYKRKCRERVREKASMSKKTRLLFVIMSVLFLAALLAAIYFYQQSQPRVPEPEGLVYEANIVQGDIPGKSPEQIRQELDEIV